MTFEVFLLRRLLKKNYLRSMEIELRSSFSNYFAMK